MEKRKNFRKRKKTELQRQRFKPIVRFLEILIFLHELASTIQDLGKFTETVVKFINH